MGLLTKEIEIGLCASNIEYYKNLGYEINKKKDKWGKARIPRGTKIKVNVEHLPKGSHVKVDVKCDDENCNKVVNIPYKQYIQYKHEDEKYYCNKCANKIFNIGKSHWHWDNDLTDEDRNRLTYEKTLWIRQVQIRDNYTCQCCNSNKDIETHHLDGWNWCKKKRYDVVNGITLCKTCHGNFHMMYGKGNNTKEQYEEWIGHAIELLKYEGELSTTRKVYCIEEDKVYDSAYFLAKEWNYKGITSIYRACDFLNKKNKYKYKVKTINGKHILWLDKYEKMSKRDLEKYFNESDNKSFTKVICITTNKSFNKIRDGAKYYNINQPCNITSCCQGKQKTCGKLEDGTPLVWMYYEDYLANKNNKSEE